MRLRIHRISSLIRLCVGITAIACLQVQPAAGQQAPTRLRLGSFSILMPAPARVVNTQTGNGSVATVYAASAPPVTFFLTLVRFNSPQQGVTPQLHRIVYGHHAAAFLGEVKAFLEEARI